jgi:hypothetical protein
LPFIRDSVAEGEVETQTPVILKKDAGVKERDP